ncbi:aspartate-alanine antiporter [Sesbania bispinosa]|nr:aspartate-alanine antiporter [Sesbania bispinosa]
MGSCEGTIEHHLGKMLCRGDVVVMAATKHVVAEWLRTEIEEGEDDTVTAARHQRSVVGFAFSLYTNTF